MSPDMSNIVSYLIPAYIIFWLITFLYVVSIRSRQKNLEQDVETLRVLVEKQQRDQQGAASKPDLTGGRLEHGNNRDD